jgi:flagellar motility protein MotE (MotC chaperone)
LNNSRLSTCENFNKNNLKNFEDKRESILEKIYKNANLKSMKNLEKEISDYYETFKDYEISDEIEKIKNS